MSWITIVLGTLLRRRALAIVLAAGLTAGMAQGATAAAPDPLPPPESVEVGGRTSLDRGPILALGRATVQPELYIVRLDAPAVPSYAGGIAGIPATKPDARAGQKLDPGAPAPREYRTFVQAEQAELVASIADRTGREPTVRFSYTNAVNGVAVELTRDEAMATAELPGVVSVQVDETRELQTDVGPEWIGAPAIWDGSATPVGSDGAIQGEGIVAGIIDSGINPANPSFQDQVPASMGGDEFDITNPRGEGSYVGVCSADNADIFVADFGCNDKLIGAWSFVKGPADPNSPYDLGGHGSHTASTTAGSQVDATVFSAKDTEFEFSATRNIEGVAPHANIIAYDVCTAGCPLTAILAAIDQAIVDGVDVINYSIGGPAASNPWSDLDALGYLNARAAGIYVATSAGSSGPGAATVGSPADVPWITSVGATQHNRQWQAEVRELTAGGGGTYPDIGGLGFSAPTDGVFPLVEAADLGSALCLEEDLAGQDLTGQIVVCDRGVTGRVQKGQVVAALGAEGMVLANDAPSGDSLNADAHALPAVHITYDDGVALKAWMESVTGEQASLSGGLEEISPELADIMAASSSRGPNRAVDIVSPSVSAPGVDVMAAYGSDNAVEWAFISGTSMASPHVAGSFALLKAVNPDWSPAQAQSALMTTSVTDITDNDGTPADWFDMGSGRADLTVAANAGLVLDEDEADYLAANPATGGDPKALNLPSMANSQCLQTCTWTRTVTGTSTGAGAWTGTGSALTDGVSVSVEPATFTLGEDESVELTITADVRNATNTEDYQFGAVTLTHEGTAPEAHMPVAVLPSTGVLPEEIVIDTRRDAGSQESQPIEAIEITDLGTEVSGLTPADQQELSIQQDTTNADPYDGNGTATVLVDVPEGGAARLIASLSYSTAPDMNLFVGQGSEPSAATQVCASATATADEFCDVGDAEAGTWWILAQNWQASAPDVTDTVTLSTAVVAGDQGNMTVEGPQSQPSGEPFTLRAFYDEPELDAGETWYGAVSLGSSPASPGDIGTIPVTLNRFGDDVAKEASTETATPGDTVDYTLTVQPNVTPEDLEYTITDTIPDGMTYAEGSATNGATVQDGVLTWTGTLPPAVGAPGDYTITTSGTDTSCVNPFTGTAEYTDLAAFGILAQPGITGDGVAYSGFSGESFGFYGRSTTGVGFTDDGFLVHDVAASYAPGTPQTLPDTAAPNNLAAMMWQDMQITYDASANSGVSLASAGDLKIIEYDDMRLAGDAAGAQGTYDFEAFLVTGSNDIVFAYDNVTGPVTGPLTIGTEDAEGHAGTALVNNGSAAGVVGNDTIVCLSYSDARFEPVVIDYQVTVDDDVANGQVMTNAAVHTTDNPGAKPVTESVDVVADVMPTVTVAGTQDAVEHGQDGAFTFTRPSQNTEGELTVVYTVDGSAQPGQDYVPLDGAVTFSDGQTTATETVEAVDQRRRSPKERTIEVTLTEGEGYLVGDPATASIEVVDDKAKPDKPGKPGKPGRP